MTTNAPIDEPTELVRAAAELARLAGEGAELAQTTATAQSNALVPAGSQAAAVATRAQLAENRALIARKRAEIEAAQEAMRAEMDKQMRAALAALEPMKELVARLEEGIATVNLYLGRDEHIVTLRGEDFEAAPAGTPITVRQEVLFMDEESAIGAEHGGIDARDIDAFDDWLVADDAHLNQVIPEERAVVAIMPRRNRRDYGDPWVNAQLNDANRVTYFLIRNGARVYRMTTAFDVGQRLVPSRDEFLMPTKDIWGRPLEPGSREWLETEKKVSARERHFMRVALILQGLIDRTTVFHPLPAANVSLLDPDAYDRGLVRLLDESMALGTSRQPFREWQRERMALLRPGMRIVGNFSELLDGGEDGRWERQRRMHPPTSNLPKSDRIYRIERREKSDFIFMYERDQAWMTDADGTYELRTPKTRASFRLTAGDSFVIPFDLVTAAECEAYLAARTERRHYASMFPALKAVIAAKREEEEAEAPVRALVASELVKAYGIDLDDAQDAAGELVTWWKVGNRWHRALSSDETKAIHAIIAEYGRRANAHTSDDEPVILAALKSKHPDALLIARKRDGSWVVVDPQPRRWPEAVSSCERVYVTQTLYPKSGRGDGKVAEWKIVEPAHLSRWRVLHEGLGWATWDKAATAATHLTDPEIEDLAAQLRDLPGNTVGGTPFAVTYGEYYNSITYSLSSWSVYLLPHEDAGWDPQHLLTNPPAAQQYAVVECRWTRRAGKAVLTVRPRTDRRTGEQLFAGRSERWGARDLQPWTKGGRDVPVPVWLDEQVVATMHERRVRHAERADARTALVAQANAALASIESAWVEEAEAAAYERFLQDFADPGLWEGHRKTLTLRYPYAGRLMQDYDALSYLVTVLVESGHDLTGLTVAQALELWGQPLTATSRWGTKTFEVPADVLHLRFSAQG